MAETTLNTVITKDKASKTIRVVREFAAPPEKVWKCWTEADLLDQWWAPKPWKAKTKSMDFREGGYWLYCMQGPDGTEIWSRVDFKTIDAGRSFTAADYFCDVNGQKDNSHPSMEWKNVFSASTSGTKVEVDITFEKAEDMEKIIEMGFESGFTAAHGNLDELLAK